MSEHSFYHPGLDTHFEGTIEQAAELDAQASLTIQEAAMVADILKIAQLEGQLETALKMIVEQNDMLAIAADIVVAARAFVEVITAQHAKTGEPVFKTTHGDDNDPIVETLNFRFTDLSAALNRAGRPVAPRLAQGTIH